jgi:serine/threonine-protein kinase
MSLDQAAMQIVEDALDLDSPEARAAFVAQACKGDMRLHQRVEQLLASDDTDSTLGPDEDFLRPLGANDPLPEVLGPWRLAEEIARGGMGAVARAERCDGLFEQTVAIKLIRADIASPRARERFATERRILARLHHPGIVRIIDGGAVEGRPWLAMDFIDGQQIDAALELRKASREDRLAAFVAVADAVAYAHRQLIVHGDIKPSNVLMDAAGEVHLLDFGIGRFLADIDRDEAVAARYPITRSFAAPERSGGGAPTVASDVFSLGMLLLTMLGHDVPGRETPCVPGTRLPAGVLEGDLAAIAACALAEQPDRRYPDVAALVQDVRRHLANRPVSVRMAEGWRYIAGRFVSRNRRGLALTAGLAALLLVIAAGAASQFLRAQLARAEADARFEDARAVSRYLVFGMIPALEDTPRSLAQRVAAAQVAERYLNRLAGARQADPELQIETAEGLLQLAMLQGRPGRPNLGQPEAAERNLVRAENIAAGASGSAGRAQHLLARIRIERVRLAVWRRIDLAEADRLAASARQAVARAGRQDAALQRDLTLVLAEVRGFQGRYDEQAKLADAALVALEKEGPDADPLDRAALLSLRAEADYYLGHPEAALPLYREGLATLFQARQRNDGPYVAGRLARAYWEVGTTLIELRHYAEAIDQLTRGEAVAQQVIAFEPSSDDARRIHNILVVARAQALGLAGRTDEALAALRANLSRQKTEALARHTPESVRNAAYASTLIGETLNAAGRKSDACLADRRAQAEYEGLRASGLLTPYDERDNLAEVNARIARNCT